MSQPHHSLLHRFRSLYLWHRYMGLGVAVLAIWLAISGIALNHSHDLSLDKSPVAINWLLDAYGISAPPARAFKVDDHWFSQIGAQIYRDTTPVAECAGSLQQITQTNDFVFIVCQQAAIILLPDGTHVDTLQPPASIRSASLMQDQLVIHTSQGAYFLGSQLLSWQKITGAEPNINAANTRQLPTELYQQLTQAYRGQALSWERVLRDAHSGRLLGTLGVWLVDAAGVLLILLALSGILVWLQRRRARKQHSQ